MKNLSGRLNNQSSKVRGGFGTLTLMASLIAMASVGCGSSNATFSMLGQSQAFQQAAATSNNKIDILWVVDNSGSMDPLQASLVTNFGTFISNFSTKGFDYKMAVTTTDAYLADPTYDNQPTLAKFRDGVGGDLTGYYYITQLIPNVVTNFVTNATQGSNGSGDERAYQSMFQSMNSSLNTGFRRAGAFFAVIILSDEDDFTDYTRPEVSWLSGGIPDHDYSDPNLVPVSTVKAQLDTMTASTTSLPTYNVSAITVLDSTCVASHISESPSTIVGQRYIDLVNSTNGILGSVCDASFATSLGFIQERIVELTTAFALSIVPDTTTITVAVNGVTVSQNATNGWTYDSTTNSIMFHGTAVPPANAAIAINFTPLHLL
jgi:hypothetical protein